MIYQRRTAHHMRDQEIRLMPMHKNDSQQKFNDLVGFTAGAFIAIMVLAVIQELF